MIFVFDTNVLMSVTFTEYGTFGILRRLWREKRFRVASSDAILAEVERVLGYERIQAIHQWSAARRTVHIANLRRDLTLYPGTTPVSISVDDQTDTKFLPVAEEATADAIVTGDGDLLRLHRYKGIHILTPAQCIERFFPDEQPR